MKPSFKNRPDPGRIITHAIENRAIFGILSSELLSSCEDGTSPVIRAPALPSVLTEGRQNSDGWQSRGTEGIGRESDQCRF